MRVDGNFTGYRVFSSDNCAPCKTLYKYLQRCGIRWPILYTHAVPQEFTRLGIRSTPTLVKGDEIVAIGLGDIMKYVKRLTYFDVTEEGIDPDTYMENKYMPISDEEE